MNNKQKIIFSIIFSSLLTRSVWANVDYNSLFNPEIKKIEASEVSSQILTPFQIQGNFETGWEKKNFWNPNDNGGVAIGPYQIHSKYLLDSFFNYLENNSPKYYNMLNEKGGTKAIKKNNPEMREFFCELCYNDKEFVRLQEEFIDKENFQPRLKILKSKYGLDISSRASSIEGLFRVMSANIGWRTNDVVKDMIKSNPNMNINSVSDKRFIEITQQSIHKIIKRDISPKFRDYLINAYDRTINNDIIPNMQKENFAKFSSEEQYKMLGNLRPHVYNANFNSDKNYFIKRNKEEFEEVKSSSNDKNNLPNLPKKPDVIVLKKVEEKNEPTNKRPSLLHKAELIRAELLKEENKSIDEKVSLLHRAEVIRANLVREELVFVKKNSDDTKAIDDKKIVKNNVKANKKHIITVDEVMKEGNSKKFDFSSILSEASSYII